MIHCSQNSPTLSLVEIPLKMRITNEKEVNKLIVYQPFTIKIEVENRSDKVVDSEVSVDESDDFYIGGELKTLVALMPRESYTFNYNLIPLQIGRLSLPRFNLAELLDAPLQQAPPGKDSQPPQQERSFLIKGLTKRCLVSK